MSAFDDLAEVAKESRTYDWVAERAWEHIPARPVKRARPGREGWLLVRRSLEKPTELAYYLSTASADTLLLTLAQVAATRYIAEHCIEEAKGETGFDEYVVRSWHSWCRHITLSMMAHTWLAAICSQAEKRKRRRWN